MIEKQNYINKIETVENILEKNSMREIIAEQANNIKNLIDDYAFRVVMIGGFSSGKSAFINRLVGKELLQEDQNPETAMAAELMWGDSEKAFAVYQDGKINEIQLDGVTKNPPKDAQYIVIHTNSTYFSKHRELILVDFPGYDSKIEEHDKAINNYIQRGSAFILMIPAKNGTLGENDRQFIKEAARYPQGLSCFLSKVDLESPEKIKGTIECVKKGIYDIYGVHVPVEPISILDDFESQDNFIKKVDTAIDKFDPQDLFNTTFKAPINSIIRNAISAISTKIESSSLNVEELEQRIYECEQRKLSLEKELDKEVAALNSKYDRELIPSIIESARNALNYNSTNLVEAALSGDARFSDLVQSLLRPILNEIPGRIETSLRDVVGNVSLNISSGDAERGELIRDAMLEALNVISSMRSGQLGSKSPNKQNAAANGTGNLLAAGAGLALSLGGVVNPIVGVLLAMGPTLINLCFSIFGKSKEQAAREQAQSQIEGQIIPSIINRFETEVSPAIRQVRDEMVSSLKAQINEQISVQEKALKAAKDEINIKTGEFKMAIDTLNQDINALEAIVILEDNNGSK